MVIKWRNPRELPPLKESILILAKWHGLLYVVPGTIDECSDGFHDHFNNPYPKNIFFHTECGCPCVHESGYCLEIDNIEGWMLTDSLIPK